MPNNSKSVAISHNLNTIRTSKWPIVYDNIFWTLIACFYKDGEIITEINIEKYQLIAMANYSLRSNKSFVKTLDDFWERVKFIDVKDMGRNEKGINYYHSVSLFRSFQAQWSDDLSTMELKVKLDEEAKELLMQVNGYLKFNLRDYLSLHSMYSRALFRKCSEWATVGRVRITVEQLMSQLELPESCRLSQNLRARVFKPFLKECSRYFENLRIKAIKTKDRTSKVYAYEFTFAPRAVGSWIEGKFSDNPTVDQLALALKRQEELYENFESLNDKEKVELRELNDVIYRIENKLQDEDEEIKH